MYSNHVVEQSEKYLDFFQSIVFSQSFILPAKFPDQSELATVHFR